MPPPNAEQFARVLLWAVSGLRAEVASMKAQLDSVQELLGHAPSAQFVQECIQRDKQSQLNLYKEACADVGLDPKGPQGAVPGNGSDET